MVPDKKSDYVKPVAKRAPLGEGVTMTGQTHSNHRVHEHFQAVIELSKAVRH
jgi:hypothetical protein